MWLKALIVVLFIGLLISLTTGLVFLFKDVGNNRRRTLYALGVRVTLASALLITIAWGFLSGRLNSTAPWDRQLHPEQQVAPQAPRP
jgi:high-affinity Fe2+/Pb2+ permease